MSDLIFLSIPPKSKEAVKATMYRCPKTFAQVVSNECMIPMSPYVGQAMQRVTPNKIVVEASDLKEEDMKRVGKCKNCEHTLFASTKAINSLAKGKPHCIMCGSVVAMAPEMPQQLLPEVIHPEDLGDDTAVHNDMPDASDGDSKYSKVGLNDQLLAREILASMEDNDEDDDGDAWDDGESDDDDDYYDEDEDGDDEGEDDDSDADGNDYYDDGSEDNGEESDIDDDDYDDDGDLGGGATPDEEAEVHPSDDSDDSMDSTASIFASMGDGEDVETESDDMLNDAADPGDAPGGVTVRQDDMTTMQGNMMADMAAKDKVNIGIMASDALHSAVTSETATLAVLPIDTGSAMILAMVEDVGYMPYIALEASKAADAIKPLFANPAKLVETVNTVLSSSEGDLKKDLKAFGVREIHYSVRASNLIEKRIREGVAAATDALNDEKGHLVEDLRQCLAIAATEVMKNLKEDATNVVSAALSESLAKVGVRDAGLLVDQAFTNKGPEMMKTIIARALELMEKPYDSRNEIAKYVTAAVGLDVLAAAKPTATTVSVGDVVAKNLAEGSLPASVITPAGTFESADRGQVIPITAASSSNINYSSLVRNKAASIRQRQSAAITR